MECCFPCPWEEALDYHNSNLCRYSAEFKQRGVSDYLSGGGSFGSIAVKYGIHAESTVLKWVKQYNSHEELTDSRKVGGYLMAKDIRSRKTTFEERITIVEYCVAHSNDYSGTVYLTGSTPKSSFFRCFPKKLLKKLALTSWLVWGGFVLWCQSP